MEYRALIQRFAERLGLKDDIIDPDGFARVTAGELTLAMAEVEGARQLVLFIDLGPAKREVYESLLEKMFMGRGTKGSVYSINEGRLYLHRFERLDELDAEKLIDVANALLDLSTEERRELDCLSDATEPSESEGKEFDYVSRNQLIRV